MQAKFPAPKMQQHRERSRLGKVSGAARKVRDGWATCQAVHTLLPASGAAAAATAHQCTPDCAMDGRPADPGGWHRAAGAQHSSGKDQSGLRRQKPLTANACRCSLRARRWPALPAAAPWQAAALPHASGYRRTWRQCASGTLKAKPACNPATGGILLSFRAPEMLAVLFSESQAIAEPSGHLLVPGRRGARIYPDLGASLGAAAAGGLRFCGMSAMPCSGNEVYTHRQNCLDCCARQTVCASPRCCALSAARAGSAACQSVAFAHFSCLRLSVSPARRPERRRAHAMVAPHGPDDCGKRLVYGTGAGLLAGLFGGAVTANWTDSLAIVDNKSWPAFQRVGALRARPRRSTASLSPGSPVSRNQY